MLKQEKSPATRHLPTPRTWWSVAAAMVAAALIALVAPSHLQQSIPGAINGYGWNLVSRAVPAVDAADAAARVDPGLVLINTDLSYQGATGAGTGIVLDPNGVVLTNNHVVEGATQITVSSIANGQSYPASVIGYDRKHDIALVQLPGAGGLPTAPLGTSSQITVGDPVTAIGNANGQGLSRSQGSVTALNQSIVAADDLASAEQLDGLIEVSANLIPGDSGGPLVNSSGQVIGIDTAGSGKYRLSHNGGGADGFAIPIGTALSIASQIQSGASSGSVHVGPSAMLGVGVKNLARGGVPVAQVLRGSPADLVGIAPSDVITGFAGSAVTSGTTLTDLLDQHYPGNNVPVSWIDRSGQRYTANVTLAPGPVG